MENENTFTANEIIEALNKVVEHDANELRKYLDCVPGCCNVIDIQPAYAAMSVRNAVLHALGIFREHPLLEKTQITVDDVDAGGPEY